MSCELDLSEPLSPPDLCVQLLRGATVGALRLWPGTRSAAQVVRNLLQPPLKGLVLEAYGVGNGPTNNPDFIAALQEATERGIVIVDWTQCLRGRVNLEGYATGSALARAGVISGFDMTVEAALAKLVYLLSYDLAIETVKQLMRQNLRGELTEEAQLQVFRG